MAMHIAPIIREMDEARITAGVLINLDSVGYTRRAAQEGVTQPTPVVTPAGGIGFFWYLGQKITPSL